MKIIFIRHGKPDYTPCWDRGFIGHGKDLACLTETGIAQAEEVSNNQLLHGSVDCFFALYKSVTNCGDTIKKHPVAYIS